jgi:intracellular sulfur oxidation DsrE/DsrF family protein
VVLLVFLGTTHAISTELAQSAAHASFGIDERKNIRVVYDVKEDLWEAGVGKGLYFLNGLISSYKSMGVAAEGLHISVILHGATAYWLLNERAYQLAKGDPFDFNPNEHIVQALLNRGVSVEICNATMKAKGWTINDILPGVTIVHDAYSRLIDLQLRNYAYIRF